MSKVDISEVKDDKLPQSQFDKYIEERYEDQLKYYSNKAAGQQKYYRWVRWLVIVLSAFTPILIAISQWSFFEEYKTLILLFSVVFSAFIAIASSAAQAFRFHDEWVQKRKVSEMLKREKFRFDTETGAYANAKCARKLFVDNVEAILENDVNMFVKSEEEMAKRIEKEIEKTIKREVQKNK